MYRFNCQQLTHLGCTDSAVAKPKLTTVQIFPAAWKGGAFYVCNVYGQGPSVVSTQPWQQFYMPREQKNEKITFSQGKSNLQWL